jgi:adiponectin receptor
MNTPELRKVRAIMYVLLGLSAGFPFIYIEYAPKDQQQFINQKWELWPWLGGGLVYIFGAIIYGLRIPERWYPKKFDLCGSSHNFHHMMVVFGMAI